MKIHGLWWLQQNLLWNPAPPLCPSKALWPFLRKENHLLSWTPGIDIKAVLSQVRGGKVWCITSAEEPSLFFLSLCVSLSLFSPFLLRSFSPSAWKPQSASRGEPETDVNPHLSPGPSQSFASVLTEQGNSSLQAPCDIPMVIIGDGFCSHLWPQGLWRENCCFNRPVLFHFSCGRGSTKLDLGPLTQLSPLTVQFQKLVLAVNLSKLSLGWHRKQAEQRPSNAFNLQLIRRWKALAPCVSCRSQALWDS